MAAEGCHTLRAKLTRVETSLECVMSYHVMSRVVRESRKSREMREIREIREMREICEIHETCDSRDSLIHAFHEIT